MLYVYFLTPGRAATVRAATIRIQKIIRERLSPLKKRELKSSQKAPLPINRYYVLCNFKMRNRICDHSKCCKQKDCLGCLSRFNASRLDN